MLALDSPRWRQLNDASGAAGGLPHHLAKLYEPKAARSESFDFWTHLCHQGDIYTASYAAVPHLIGAQLVRNEPDWELIALAAAIESARLKHRGPAVPEDLLTPYRSTICTLPLDLSRFLQEGVDSILARAILAAMAAATGNFLLTDVLLGLSDDLALRFIDEWRFK